MIVLDRNGARFNYRVGGAIYRTGTVLLQTSDDIYFWVVPNGRVEMLESAEEALAREIREELGVEPRLGRLLWLVENLFPLDGLRFHEIGLYFLVDVPPPDVPDGEFCSPEPGTPQRLVPHEQSRDALARVFIVVAGWLPRCRRQRCACLGDELSAGLIQTHLRAARVVGTGVDVQHVLPMVDELPAGFTGPAPLLLQPRRELVSLSV